MLLFGCSPLNTPVIMDKIMSNIKGSHMINFCLNESAYIEVFKIVNVRTRNREYEVDNVNP